MPAWFLVVLPVLLVGCAADAPAPAPPDPDFRAEWDAWHDGRIDRLRNPDGWLSLAGLYWLDEGEHTVGSDSSSDIVFPPAAPGRIGTFTVEDSVVTLRVADGVEVLHDSTAVEEIVLAEDQTGDPTILELDALSWYVIRRARGLGIRLRDTESAVLRDFEGIETYAPDPAWQIEARLDPYDPPRTLMIPSITGVPEASSSPGALVFTHDGTEHRLDVTGDPGDEQYFLVFGDATNGHDTYGGGRFLVVDAPDVEGRTVIDFNRAYNPPCIFTPYATCPLPPPQNRLSFRVEAGEKTWGAAH